jgi:hypothetical protein
MKKSLLIISAFVFMITLSLAFTAPKDRIYKNLKVLPKDITKPQMDSIMKNFTVSLGVKCNFCHARTADNKDWDFASDANKHKLVARNMLKMTEKINKKFFDVTGKGFNASQMVTCYTCHNGKPEPVTRPPAAGPAENRQPKDTTKRQ